VLARRPPARTWEVLGHGGVEDLLADGLDEGRPAGDGALLLAGDEHDDALVAALLNRRVPLLQHLVRVLERVGFALQRRSRSRSADQELDDTRSSNAMRARQASAGAYRELADGDEVEADVLAGLEVARQPLDVGLGHAAQHASVVHHVRVHGGPVVQHVELRRRRRRGRGRQADGQRQRGRRQAVVQERHPAPADGAGVSVGGGSGGDTRLRLLERAGDDGGPGRDGGGSSEGRSPGAAEWGEQCGGGEEGLHGCRGSSGKEEERNRARLCGLRSLEFLLRPWSGL
jgi:hypothetical protein